jgi:anti-sigma B factor antagonist
LRLFVVHENRLKEAVQVSVKLTTRQVGDVTVIDAAGRITLGEGASAFREAIRDIAAKGGAKVLLNLSEITYIDSSGIGELVSGFTTVRNQGGVLKLMGLTKRVQDLLQITKLYTVFDVYDDEATAIRSFA